MKKLFGLIMALVLMGTMFTGCGEKGGDTETSIEANTVATKLQVAFKSEVKTTTDTEALANALGANDIVKDLNIVSMPVEEGYLNGFDAEINGFDKGCVFSPMIGTIPFVGYIFETSDADALIETLKAHAQLNWNICTVADEMVADKEGNIVFFVMAPTSFDNY